MEALRKLLEELAKGRVEVEPKGGWYVLSCNSCFTRANVARRTERLRDETTREELVYYADQHFTDYHGRDHDDIVQETIFGITTTQVSYRGDEHNTFTICFDPHPGKDGQWGGPHVGEIIVRGPGDIEFRQTLGERMSDT